MLTTDNFTDRNFTYYESEPKVSGVVTVDTEDAVDRDIYLALATKEKDDGTKIEFPIKLSYLTDTGELTVSTRYNIPSLPNEYFFIGEILTEEEFDAYFIDIFKYNIEKIDMNALDSYYENF